MMMPGELVDDKSVEGGSFKRAMSEISSTTEIVES
jgi:hypothetical protein